MQTSERNLWTREGNQWTGKSMNPICKKLVHWSHKFTRGQYGKDGKLQPRGTDVRSVIWPAGNQKKKRMCTPQHFSQKVVHTLITWIYFVCVVVRFERFVACRKDRKTKVFLKRSLVKKVDGTNPPRRDRQNHLVNWNDFCVHMCKTVFHSMART